jgi:hypothetical protein
MGHGLMRDVRVDVYVHAAYAISVREGDELVDLIMVANDFFGLPDPGCTFRAFRNGRHEG